VFVVYSNESPVLKKGASFLPRWARSQNHKWVFRMGTNFNNCPPALWADGGISSTGIFFRAPSYLTIFNASTMNLGGSSLAAMVFSYAGSSSLMEKL
jgi:hypothetical protein